MPPLGLDISERDRKSTKAQTLRSYVAQALGGLLLSRRESFQPPSCLRSTVSALYLEYANATLKKTCSELFAMSQVVASKHNGQKTIALRQTPMISTNISIETESVKLNTKYNYKTPVPASVINETLYSGMDGEEVEVPVTAINTLSRKVTLKPEAWCSVFWLEKTKAGNRTTTNLTYNFRTGNIICISGTGEGSAPTQTSQTIFTPDNPEYGNQLSNFLHLLDITGAELISAMEQKIQ